MQPQHGSSQPRGELWSHSDISELQVKLVRTLHECTDESLNVGHPGKEHNLAKGGSLQLRQTLKALALENYHQHSLQLGQLVIHPWGFEWCITVSTAVEWD